MGEAKGDRLKGRSVGGKKMRKRAPVSGKIYSVETSLIKPNRSQPRVHFDPDELEALSKSIKENGLLQPISIRRCGEGYELIAGERRLRAAAMAGFERIPAIIVSATDNESAVLALIENTQRTDLNPFETAEAIRAFIEKENLTETEAAKRLSMSQPAIANKLRLLNFSDFERELMIDGGLSERHARCLLRLQSGRDRLSAIENVRRRGLTVAATEKMVAAMLENQTRKKPIIFVKDVRLFVNTINKAVDTMQTAGINADFSKFQGNDFVEFRIKVPLSAATTQGFSGSNNR